MRNIDKNYHYLYRTTNLINENYYYGIHSTNNLNDGYLGSGRRLRHSIRKYGKENFKREILYYFDNREELTKAEEDILTEEMLRDKMCMNIQHGGEGFNTLGMVTVKDDGGNCFKVFKDDPRYLSGELVGVSKGLVTVKDVNENILHISVNDPRYLSGELVHNCKGTICIKDKDGNKFRVSVNDPRIKSGELVPIAKGMVLVKDKNYNILHVSVNNSRYLSGELVHNWTGKKHSDETKQKISEKAKQRTGNKNSSFGTCWITRYSKITKDNENKKIKKEDLQSYLYNGWIKGRKIK
jgi:hypothetical protein